MEKVSFQLPEEDKEFIVERLTYEKSQADWFRYVTRALIEIEEELDKLYDPTEYDRREEFVVAAVRKAVDEEMDMEPRGHPNRIEDLDPTG